MLWVLVIHEQNCMQQLSLFFWAPCRVAQQHIKLLIDFILERLFKSLFPVQILDVHSELKSRTITQKVLTSILAILGNELGASKLADQIQ